MNNYCRVLGLMGVMLILCGCFPTSTRSQVVVPELLESTTPIPSYIKDFWLATEESCCAEKPLVQLCITLDFEKLLDTRDQNLQADDHRKRSTIHVSKIEGSDRQIIQPVLIGGISAGPSIVDDRGNQLGESSFCWSYELTVGVYEANFSYMQTSGNVISHTWDFQTVEPER